MTDKKQPVWQPPTRRMFVAMLGAAAAAFALKDSEKPISPVERITNGKTRWIGHC
jgi:hypothetical protein